MNKIIIQYQNLFKDRFLLAFVIIMITLTFACLQYQFIFTHDSFVDYKRTMLPLFNSCSLNKIPDQVGPLRLYLSCLSYKLGNENISSFLTNILLIPMTYLFTVTITKKPLAGLIAMTLLGNSWMWKYWTPSVTYSQEWVLLFFIAIYLSSIGSRWVFVPYILSILCKPLVLLYTPILFYSTKLRTVLYIIGSFISTIIFYFLGDKHITSGQIIIFNLSKISVEPLVFFNLIKPYEELTILLPITLALLIIIRNKISRYFLLSLFTILGILIFTDVFTNLDNQHYRLFVLEIMTLSAFGYCLVMVSEKIYHRFISSHIL